MRFIPLLCEINLSLNLIQFQNFFCHLKDKDKDKTRTLVSWAFL